MKKIHSNSDNSLAERRAYTITEAAALLGVHRVSVYRRLYSGEIKVLKGFGQLMIPASELDRFLNDVTEYTPRRQPQHKPTQKQDATPTASGRFSNLTNGKEENRNGTVR